MVVYRFPDGRAQEVSRAVARALDVAFGERPGRNARTGNPDPTTIAPSGRPVGIRLEANSAATGDIAVWARRSAVLVVFETGNNRAYEVIVDSRLRPFPIPPDDEHDELGPFTGFHRLSTTGPATVAVDRPASAEATRSPGGLHSREKAVGAGSAQTKSSRIPPYAPADDAVPEKKPTDGGDRAAVANS